MSNTGEAALYCGKALAHFGIIGQFDDAVMLLAQLQLAHRTHHAIGFDTANGALFQLHAIGRNHRAGQAEHALHARARIGRTADDLQRLALACVDAQHLKLVRIGMFRRADDFGDAKTRQPLGRIVDPFNFEADSIKLGRNFSGIGLRIEEMIEPFARDFHALAPTPAESVGWSNALKP